MFRKTVASVTAKLSKTAAELRDVELAEREAEAVALARAEEQKALAQVASAEATKAGLIAANIEKLLGE